MVEWVVLWLAEFRVCLMWSAHRLHTFNVQAAAKGKAAVPVVKKVPVAAAPGKARRGGAKPPPAVPAAKHAALVAAPILVAPPVKAAAVAAAAAPADVSHKGPNFRDIIKARKWDMMRRAKSFPDAFVKEHEALTLQNGGKISRKDLTTLINNSFDRCESASSVELRLRA